ncbi:MAG TPA: aminopeptidase [Steroidobacter sp.]|nr:aminopeptidase [Steroidobacter sp.]
MRRSIQLRRPRLARGLLLLMLAAPSLSGCYLMQATTGQMDVIARRQPISAVLSSPATPPTIRSRLEYAASAREFASRELALPDNGSYRSYADLQRPYAAWNVFATEEFSVEPLRWCFPIAGCVVYRGYFNESAAEAYARRLRFRGYDAAVAGVPAYSTLGHFNDPILSTMLHWSDAQLAGTLFHELAHQVAYAPGDSQFNEAFATVVEETGVERWLAAAQRSNDLQVWRVHRERHLQFISLLLEARERLGALYRSDLGPAQKRDRKQYEFGALKLAYAQLKREWRGDAGYDRWFERTLSNADLVSAATYYACVPELRQRLAALGGDLAAFYEEARKLAALSKDERRLLLCKQPP